MHNLIESELIHERQRDLLSEASRERLAKRARRSTRRPVPREGEGT